MKTLTITDAKKNLGRWLQSAARGEHVAIICGADIIALRKIEVAPVAESHGYAIRPDASESIGRSEPARPAKKRPRTRRRHRREAK